LRSLPQALSLKVTPEVTQALQKSASGVSTGAGKIGNGAKMYGHQYFISNEAFYGLLSFVIL